MKTPLVMLAGVVAAAVAAGAAPDDDAAVIAAQLPSYPLATCVVSGEPLGGAGMGAPVDFVHAGRLVRFCCKGCVGKFEEGAAKYLARLDAAVVAAQLADYPLETCVVSGEPLGGEGMGPPIEFVHGTRLVRFCCKGCVRKFAADAPAFMAKVDEALIARQVERYPLDSCVVSGEALGGEGMGPPVDHLYGTRLVRFCCKGCVRKFAAEPGKFLAQLDAAATAR